MENNNLSYSVFLNHFIANSIFTEKQTSIIYNKVLKSKPSKNMTSGAYYRQLGQSRICLLYTSPSPRDRQKSRMPSSA